MTDSDFLDIEIHDKLYSPTRNIDHVSLLKTFFLGRNIYLNSGLD